MAHSSRYEMDMTNGPLLGKLIRFSLPLMFSSMLQLLYNAADVVVVGRFASSHALAAVSSTGSLIALIINLFMGMSLGASVLVAQAYGSGDRKDISDNVHTTIALALVFGVIVTIVGIALAEPMLIWMDSPPEVRGQAIQYVQIFFAGSIFNLLYNFGAAILRAVGDTKRPMYYLMSSGLVNVILNLIFVIVFHMGVVGVALATIISQIVSAVLVVLCLIRSEGAIHLDVRKIRIQKDKALRLIRIGFPAGLQSTIFAISNVLIQSSVNSFGAAAMAGNGAAANIENFIYVAMNTFYQAALTFTSQNVGARKPRRIHPIMWQCQACVVAVGIAMGVAFYFLRPVLLGIYSTDPEVIAVGMVRMSIFTTTYFICGVMDTLVGGLRGLGNSFAPMIVSVLGACVLRVVWIYTIFAMHRSLFVLYLSYPVSWLVTGSVHLICFIISTRRITRRIEAEDALSQA